MNSAKEKFSKLARCIVLKFNKHGVLLSLTFNALILKPIEGRDVNAVTFCQLSRLYELFYLKEKWILGWVWVKKGNVLWDLLRF
jgi:hypothetical protein